MGVNKLVLYQITFFVLIIVLTFCILVPISYHLYDFKGQCLLFTNGSWGPTDGKFIANWASQAYCDYNLAFSLISLIFALSQVYRFLIHLCKDTDAGFLGAFFDVLIAVLSTLGALVGALFITLGYQVWCDAIIQRFESCEDAQSNSIFSDDGIDTTMFYMQFGTAQFGAWALWVCWVGLSVVSFLKICNYHQLENIRASMAQDRARLVSK